MVFESSFYEKVEKLTEIGEYKRALQFLTEALKEGIDTPQLYFHIGFNYNRLKDRESALEALDKAISLQKDYIEARLERIIVLTRLNKYDEALKECYKVIALRKDNPIVYYYMGEIYYLLGKWQDVVDALEKAKFLGANYYQLHYYLSVALKQLNDLSKALEACNEALKVKKDFQLAIDLKSELFKRVPVLGMRAWDIQVNQAAPSNKRRHKFATSASIESASPSAAHVSHSSSQTLLNGFSYGFTPLGIFFTRMHRLQVHFAKNSAATSYYSPSMARSER